MDSKFGALRAISLPFGATSGQRIVLNGDTGTIQIYNTSNDLVAELSPTDVISIFDASGAEIDMHSANPPAILFTPGTFGVHVVAHGSIGVDTQSGPDRARLLLASPELDGRDRLQLTLEEDTGSGASCFVSDTGGGNQAHLKCHGDIEAVTDAIAAGFSLPRGLVAAPAQITSNFASGGSAEADVTGLSVTWTADSSRRYRVMFHARGISTSVVGRVRAIIADASNTHFAEGDYNDTAVNVIEAAVDIWTPSLFGLSGSQTFKARCATLTGGGNWTLGATPEATLTVEDVGAL